MDDMDLDTFVSMLLMFLGVALLCFFLVAVFLNTEVGDVMTTRMETPVYESYDPEKTDKLGSVVCNLPKDTKVTIRQILTTNDTTNGEKTAFTGIQALKVESKTGCYGWVLPKYLRR